MATFVVCLLVGGSLGSCSSVGLSADCSDSDLAETDRIAAAVWQSLDSSNPDAGAYCDSSRYPYVGGSMEGPATELLLRAVDDLGCEETAVEGYDSEYAATLDCDLDETSYLLEIERQVDPYGGPDQEVGVYKR